MLFKLQLINCFRMLHSNANPLSTFWDTMKRSMVLQSLCNDVYKNLAVEDWIHDNMNLQDGQILFMWINDPAVVIGRHQNPWKECNLHLMRANRVCLARRKSGGGTVYHDKGNINFTFFTSKKQYDRMENLKLIINALRRLRPQLNVEANSRYDLVLDGKFKISGTAAKIGRTVAYHHCTLLYSVDWSFLPSVLHSSSQGIHSNATPSVPALVKNVWDVDPTLSCQEIMDAVALEYAAQNHATLYIKQIDPQNENVFPGISNKINDLQTWDWIYGKTPKFSVSNEFDVIHERTCLKAKINMDIKSGRIAGCTIDVPSNWLPGELCFDLQSKLIGNRFCPNETLLVCSDLLQTCPKDLDLHSKWSVLCERMIAVM